MSRPVCKKVSPCHLYSAVALNITKSNFLNCKKNLWQACPWEWDSHGKCPMGWDGTARIAFPMGPMGQYPRDSVLIMSYLTLGFILFCFKQFFLVHFFLYKDFPLALLLQDSGALLLSDGVLGHQLLEKWCNLKVPCFY